MKTQRKLSKRISPTADAERLALLIVQEAKTSFGKCARIVGKLVALAVLGFVLTSNCCLPVYCVPIGVITLSIAAGWLDVIREECSCHRFFPSKNLNCLGASVFHWSVLAGIACTLFALSSMRVLQSLDLDLVDRVCNLMKYAAVPLALMLLGRASEPYRFKRARADIRSAENVVRQLVTAQKPSDIAALAPLIEAEKIPVYKLGSVASLLKSFAAGFEATDKLNVELTQTTDAKRKGLLTLIYTPFRTVAGEMFLWESRDIVLYSVVVLYIACLYSASFFVPYSPIFILVPFIGPKSRAGRFLRDLQDDVRLAQGVSVEKKRGLQPEQPPATGCPPINWPMATYVIGNHIVAVYTLVVLGAFGGVCPVFGNGAAIKWETIGWAFVLYVCSALGITAGVHRLWSHKSYKAAFNLRLVLMIFNSIANQGCIFHWARDHRVHHLYSDTVADPHDATRGFWFSHVGWLLFKKNPAVIEAGKKLNLSDLYSDPVVMFQKRTDPFWNLIWCFGMSTFPVLYWGDTIWNGFLVAGILRYVLLLNATWAVNSVVHHWGAKPYNPAHLTTENGWVSLFAIGEGWHNWHHAFDWDYAAAELGALMQFNPTKVFIDTMALFGLVWDRKRATKHWGMRKKRWEEDCGRPVEECVEGPLLFKHRVVTFGPAPYGEDAQPESHPEAEAEKVESKDE